MSALVRAAAAVLRLALAVLERVPGPVFWNEVRYSFLRGRGTGWILGGISAACAVSLCAGVAGWLGTASADGAPPGRKLFFVVSIAMMGSILVCGPALSAGSFIRDKNKRTLDLLLSSGLAPWEIVVGKTAFACFHTLACMAAGLPCLAVAYSLGGVGSPELAKHLVLFASWAAVTSALGVSLSLFFRSYALTLMATFLLVLILMVATIYLTMIAFVFLKLMAGLWHPGFWLISSLVNGGLAVAVLGGTMLVSGPLSRWDY